MRGPVKLYPYQQALADSLLRINPKRLVITRSQIGNGLRCAVAAALPAGRDITIMSPKVLRAPWLEEVKRFAGHGGERIKFVTLNRVAYNLRVHGFPMISGDLLVVDYPSFSNAPTLNRALTKTCRKFEHVWLITQGEVPPLDRLAMHHHFQAP